MANRDILAIGTSAGGVEALTFSQAVSSSISGLRPRYHAVLTSVSIPACASEIRRVVTPLDKNNRSTTLFDSQVPLEAGKSGIPGAPLWVTDSNPGGFLWEDTAKKQVALRYL